MSLPVAPDNLGQYQFIGGIDEVGRGCFAGPVVSALVILPKDFECDLINDSKKLSEKKRLLAYDIIIENAIAYTIQAVSVKQINKIGIDAATYLSMQKCINDITLNHELNYLLIDGDRWDEYEEIPYETVVKGDSTYMSIAAASIIAKVKRDEYMVKLAEKFPNYGFESNKGYFSKVHGAGLKSHGPTDYHRTLFVRNHI